MQKQVTDIYELNLGTKLCCTYWESSKPSRHGPCPHELTLQTGRQTYMNVLSGGDKQDEEE